jgi:2-keto-4-pentenoate hydratase/2-oxohepta-3-ene-1,7-dioic acid hydratase in catechol pathway
MRYATFSLPPDTTLRLGVVRGDRMIDTADARARWRGKPPAGLLDLIRLGPEAWRHMQEIVVALPDAVGHPLGTVRWHAPVPRPLQNVVCLGRNYAAHVREAAHARGVDPRIPTAPVFFTKAVTSVIGPFDDIPLHRTVTSQVDWEVELAVVIGTGGVNIPRARAFEHVFGYTVLNDVSARDLQQRHLQWFKGKSLDGFCPMGPVVVTADEFGDPGAKRLTCRVNGDPKQDATTALMIFPIDVIIESLSQGATLEAGDIIATGTPEGVGMGRTPQEFLQEGDVVETEVEGIGVMRNRFM